MYDALTPDKNSYDILRIDLLIAMVIIMTILDNLSDSRGW
jgi:hypothetical protein